MNFIQWCDMRRLLRLWRVLVPTFKTSMSVVANLHGDFGFSPSFWQRDDETEFTCTFPSSRLYLKMSRKYSRIDITIGIPKNGGPLVDRELREILLEKATSNRTGDIKTYFVEDVARTSRSDIENLCSDIIRSLIELNKLLRETRKEVDSIKKKYEKLDKELLDEFRAKILGKKEDLPQPATVD